MRTPKLILRSLHLIALLLLASCWALPSTQISFSSSPFTQQLLRPRYLSSSPRQAPPRSFGLFSYSRHPARLGPYDPLVGVRDIILHQGLPEAKEAETSRPYGDRHTQTQGHTVSLLASGAREHADKVLWVHGQHLFLARQEEVSDYNWNATSASDGTNGDESNSDFDQNDTIDEGGEADTHGPQNADIDENPSDGENDEWYWAEDDGSDPEEVDCSQTQGPEPQSQRRDGRNELRPRKKGKSTNQDDVYSQGNEDDEAASDQYDQEDADGGYGHAGSPNKSGSVAGSRVKAKTGKEADAEDDNDEEVDSDRSVREEDDDNRSTRHSTNSNEKANKHAAASSTGPSQTDSSSSPNKHSSTTSDLKTSDDSKINGRIKSAQSSGPGGTSRFTSQSTTTGRNTNPDCSALARFYTATSGENWLKSTGWNDKKTADCCTWFGITCQQLGVTARKRSKSSKYSVAEDGKDDEDNADEEEDPSDTGASQTKASGTTDVQKRVIAIDLIGNGLVGPLPTALFDLDALIRLDVSNNAITSLPDRFDSFARLTHFKASNNSIAGTIPPSLLSSQSLVSLNLASNKLTGTVSLSAPNLVSLALQNNQLGTFSTSATGMVSLQKVYLGENTFKGSLPDLSQAASLSVFDASNNSTGPLFDLTHLTNLSYFDVRQNQLTGPMPSTLAPNVALSAFYISNNNLTGPFPADSAPPSLIHCSVSPNPITPCPPPSVFNDKSTLASICHMTCPTASQAVAAQDAGPAGSAVHPGAMPASIAGTKKKAPGIPVSPLPGEAAVPLAIPAPAIPAAPPAAAPASIGIGVAPQIGLVAPAGIGGDVPQNIVTGMMADGVGGDQSIIEGAAAIRQTGGASRTRYNIIETRRFRLILSLTSVVWLKAAM